MTEMWEIIKDKVQNMHTTCTFGISKKLNASNCYFLEVYGNKKDKERFYVDKCEFDILFNLEKIKLSQVEQYKIKKAKQHKAILEEKKVRNKLKSKLERGKDGQS